MDFAVHISYHFVASASTDPNESARDALGALGTPIVQGAASTLIAISVLSTSTTYMFRTFFKVVFLVMVFGLLHAIAVLPVVLSTLNCSRCNKKSKLSENKAKTAAGAFECAIREPQYAFDNPAMTRVTHWRFMAGRLPRMLTVGCDMLTPLPPIRYPPLTEDERHPKHNYLPPDLRVERRRRRRHDNYRKFVLPITNAHINVPSPLLDSAQKWWVR